MRVSLNVVITSDEGECRGGDDLRLGCVER